MQITSPASSTTFTAGQQATIKWQDDGAPPSLAQFGPAKVSIYTGDSAHQTPLQLIAANVDVSKTSAIEFTPDPAIGADGNNYFIRIESLSLKDPTQPQYPALAFSSKFTLTGTSGSSSANGSTGNSTAPASSSSPKASAAATATHTAAAAKVSGNAAADLKTSSISLLMAVIVGAAMF
ncbi:hypothetical protein AX15_000945 [Amanita polypyramis BW_CC]|nr:hypothetical protein AX15_000945 [Amanita polypyramis BW_CC]